MGEVDGVPAPGRLIDDCSCITRETAFSQIQRPSFLWVYIMPSDMASFRIMEAKETKKRFLQFNAASLQCSRIQEVILKHFGIVQDLAFGG